MRSHLRGAGKGHGQERRLGSWTQALCMACLFAIIILFLTMQSLHSSLNQAVLEDEDMYLPGDIVEEKLNEQASKYRKSIEMITMGDEGGEHPVRTRHNDTDADSLTDFEYVISNSSAEELKVKYKGVSDPEVFRALYSLGLNPKKTTMNARIGTALRMLGINPIKNGRPLHWRELLEGESNVDVAHKLLGCNSDSSCTPADTLTELNFTQFQEKGFAGPFALEGEDGSADGFAKMGEEWKIKRERVGADLAGLGMQQPWDGVCFMWHQGCYDLATNPSILSVVKKALGLGVMLYAMSFESSESGVIQLMHTDAEPANCKASVTVVIGTPMRFLRESHTIDYKISMTRALRLQLSRGKALLANKDHSRKAMDQALLGMVEDSKEFRGRSVGYESLNVGAGSFVVFSGHIWHASLNPDSVPRNSVVLQYARCECAVREPLGFMGIAFQRIPLVSPILPPVLLLSDGPMLGLQYMNDIRKWNAFQQEDTPMTSALLKDIFPPSKSVEDVSWTDSDLSPSNSNFVNKPTVVPYIAAQAEASGIMTHNNLLKASTSILERVTATVFIKTLPGQVMSTMHKHSEEELLMMVEGRALILRSGDGLFSGRREFSEVMAGAEVFFPANSSHAIIAETERVTYVLIRWRPRMPEGEDAQAAMAAAQQQARARLPQQQFLERKIMDYKQFRLRPLNGLQGINSYAFRFQTGQGYDPGNQYGFDVLEIGLMGAPEILPTSVRMPRLSMSLVPANTPHLLWNSARFPVLVLLIEFHPLRLHDNRTAWDEGFDIATFGHDSKIMR